jgi:hypothetical protein
VVVGRLGTGAWYSLVEANETVFTMPASLSSLKLDLNRRVDRNNGRVEEGGTTGGVRTDLGPAPSSVEFGGRTEGRSRLLWCQV